MPFSYVAVRIQYRWRIQSKVSGKESGGFEVQFHYFTAAFLSANDFRRDFRPHT